MLPTLLLEIYRVIRPLNMSNHCILRLHLLYCSLSILCNSLIDTTAEQRTIIQQYGDWYTGRWRGAVTFGIQCGAAWTGCGPAQSFSRCTKCNKPPIHEQCTSVPYSMWRYNWLIPLWYLYFFCLCLLLMPASLLIHLSAVSILSSSAFVRVQHYVSHRNTDTKKTSYILIYIGPWSG